VTIAIIDLGKSSLSPARDESLIFFIIAVQEFLPLLFHPPFLKNLYLKGDYVPLHPLLNQPLTKEKKGMLRGHLALRQGDCVPLHPLLNQPLTKDTLPVEKGMRSGRFET
jgi:hypothetical protein